MRYAVLAMLVERGPGYAYDVTRRFEEAMGPTFEPNRGGIHQHLDALENDGLITGAYESAAAVGASRRRRGGPRVVYEATAAGVAEYERWINTPARLEPMRNQLALKLALSRPEHGPALLGLCDEYEKACLERLREHSLAAEDRPIAPDRSWDATLTALARARAARLLDAELEWVRDIRDGLVTIMARGGRERSR